MRLHQDLQIVGKAPLGPICTADKCRRGLVTAYSKASHITMSRNSGFEATRRVISDFCPRLTNNESLTHCAEVPPMPRPPESSDHYDGRRREPLVSVPFPGSIPF